VEAPSVAALVTAAAGFATALATLIRQHRADGRQQQADRELVLLRDELAEQRQTEARHRDAAEQLAQHREPLLEAAEDLRHRIGNIRDQERSFAGYLHTDDERRSRMAVLGTLYRLAKYWGTVERLYGTVDMLAFEENPSTRAIARVLREVGKAWANDEQEFGGRELMIWREEQRAIAELMRRGAPEDKPVIGFAAFVERYDAGEFGDWLTELERGLRSPGIQTSPRIGKVQEGLTELVTALEEGRHSVTA
jgi:hypothetical protein